MRPAPVLDVMRDARPVPNTRPQTSFVVSDLGAAPARVDAARPRPARELAVPASRPDLVASPAPEMNRPAPEPADRIAARGHGPTFGPSDRDTEVDALLRVAAGRPDLGRLSKPATLTGPENPFSCIACAMPPPFGSIPDVAVIVAEGAGDASDYLEHLRSYGFRRIETRRARLPVAQPQVRYFRAADAGTAQALAEQVSAELVDLTWFLPTPDGGLIEILLSEDFQRH
ncbi:hypothetical protein [uncultured Jannaschia sp.]|uniref:hypothetical protein n=1 Tax=uncultured Jannaschia sp. TaxID=293347 RepID=UPI00261F5A53|nr:hypothetical protein [uncultured Jannaschia sp.]